jgi:hypothetical protein
MMDEAQELQAKIARYRRTRRAVFHPDVLRRLGQMIEIAEKRLAEIESARLRGDGAGAPALPRAAPLHGCAAVWT